MEADVRIFRATGLWKGTIGGKCANISRNEVVEGNLDAKLFLQCAKNKDSVIIGA
ncbi:hypothetical protein KCTCHS21_20190 [Cohnella abietis]|uniref:Uncharacterized protein n=1 Tax=Cohnella abietis TaxID=2507935 RepID=A0A3T1D3C9_9BACL|nr:hypothetical protein KCTCHS21_20190 [Cohnella abietis]